MTTVRSAHCDTLIYCALEIFLLTYLLTYVMCPSVVVYVTVSVSVTNVQAWLVRVHD